MFGLKKNWTGLSKLILAKIQWVKLKCPIKGRYELLLHVNGIQGLIKSI
jgi:hypothetical protein